MDTVDKTTYRTKLLLVDDHPENLLALTSILDAPGYHCVLAHSGREALSILLKEQDFSVILLDVQMPELDGFETARLIQEREKTRDIPIIFITAAYTSLNNMLQGYDLNAADYIIKPFNEKLLRKKISVFAELHHKTRRAVEELQELKSLVRFGDSHKVGDERIVSSQQPITEYFDELVLLYQQIINAYFYEQIYKTKNSHSQLLRPFCQRLGSLQATPKDIIKIHLASIERASQENNEWTVSTYIEEGRILLLEAVGELALYYQSCVAMKCAVDSKQSDDGQG